MKQSVLLIFFLIVASQTFSQIRETDSLKIYSTTLKINLTGLRVGIEQKILKRATFQLEGLFINKNWIKINPQIRYYPSFFKHRLSYIGLGFYYKHQENNFTDSVKIIGSNSYYLKDFQVCKYIQALTLNYGFYYDEKFLNLNVHYEFSLGLGIRFKKSNRYGLLPNEEIDYREAFIMRPQAYQDTKGNLAVYPEINLMYKIVLPLRKSIKILQ